MSRFPLPLTVFDQHILVLGKTRSGKSSTIRGMVEDRLGRELPVTIIDPKGDWWGLKASADGKEAGFPVVIFGGSHADVPLNPRSGGPVAELLATGNRSAIIDLGGWMPADRTQFFVDFASTFWRLTRGHRWLVIDEVHNFAPQGKVLDIQAGKMLHWTNRLANEGLGKGVALIAASQRPQKVHKDFVTSAETLIAMQVIHPLDRNAIKEWLDGAGDPTLAKQVLETLAFVARGEGWVWSPSIGFGPKRIQFPLFSTYDSFKPQNSGSEVKLKGWAEVDLEDVTKKLEAAVKDAEAKDPAKLRLRILELEKQLRTQPTTTKEVLVGDPKAIARAIRPWQEALEEAMKVLVKINAIGFENAGIKPDDVRGALESAAKEIGRLAQKQLDGRAVEFERLKSETNKLLARLSHLLESQDVQVDLTVSKNAPITMTARAMTAREPMLSPRLNGEFSKPERKILQALGELASIDKLPAPNAMVAAWAEYSVDGGAFNNPKGALRTAGMIDYPNPGYIDLTTHGRAKVGHIQRPTREAILGRISQICSGPEWKILSALLAHGGAEITKDTLATDSGYSVDGGAFNNPVGALRSKGLLDYPRQGLVKAAEWLFTL